MGDVDVSRDNALIERFFGSLKHGWIIKVHQQSNSLQSLLPIE